MDTVLPNATVNSRDRDINRPISSDDSSANDKVMNNFEDYGFTANNSKLRGTIYEEVYCGRGHDTSFYGKVFNLVSDAPMSVTWDEKGICSFDEEGYTLTPIAPVTYPMFKKNSEGSVFKYNTLTDVTCMLDHSNIGVEFSTDKNPYTLSDVSYDSKRGLYYGQPCWYHSNIGTQVVYFGECVLEGIEPIPIKALKYMPFIWEQYKSVLGAS